MNLTLQFPNDSPTWYDFETNIPMIANETFLRRWLGAETESFFEFVKSLANYCYLDVKRLDTHDTIFLSDITASYAPAIALTDNDPQIFALLKWLGAPQGYIPPLRYSTNGITPEEIGKWETSLETYFLCEMAYPGKEILAGLGSYSRLKFTPGKHTIRYHEVNPDPAATFGLYLFEGLEEFQLLPKRTL